MRPSTVQPNSEPELFAKPAKVRAGAWVWDKDLGCLVPKYGRNYHDVSEKRADLACPFVISGTMPTIKSMVDGKYYDTKRNYEKAVHRKGCEVIGFDKDWQEHVKPPQPYGGEKAHEAQVVRDVKKAIEIEQSKMPPANGLADRRLMRKQKRQARATT